jgi:hypothetical protein
VLGAVVEITVVLGTVVDITVVLFAELICVTVGI